MSLSLKDASERIKRRAEELKEEVKGTLEGLGESFPRPLMERKTIVLKEPLLALLRRRFREKRK